MDSLILPELGEGVVEGEVVNWLVAEGDEINVHQPVLEVMTDKATVEVPSLISGIVEKLLVGPGDIVPIHEPIAKMKSNGAAASDASEEPEVAESEEAPLEADHAAMQNGTENIVASPYVRRLSREQNIDLSTVPGSGRGGRVLIEDLSAPAKAPVASHSPARAAAPVAAQPQALAAPKLEIPRSQVSGEKTVDEVPLKGLRRAIAQKMSDAKKFAPHFAHIDDADLTNLVELRKSLKPEAEKYGVRISYLPFIAKAMVAAMREFPDVNSTMDEERNLMLRKNYYNFGVAIATDAGLTVPVVRDIDQKSIIEIAADITELAERGRIGKLRPDDFGDGTCTITSLGKDAGIFATPILNHPEVGILGVNRIEERPVVRNGEVVVRHMTYFSGVFDHRVIDGHYGAGWLSTLIRYLENPNLMMIV